MGYVAGVARNSRLETTLVPWMEQARAIRAITEKPGRAFAPPRCLVWVRPDRAERQCSTGACQEL